MIVVFSLLVVCAFKCEARASSGADSATKVAESFVADAYEKLRISAEVAVRREENQRLQEGMARIEETSVYKKLTTVDDEVGKVLGEAVQKTSTPVVKELEHRAAEISKSEAKILDEWRSVRSILYKKEVDLFQVQGGKRIAGQIASLLSVDNRWFWLFGLIAFATLMGIVLHDRRHEVRRWLYGGTARAMGASKLLTGVMVFFVLVTLTTFFFGDRVFNALLLVGSENEVAPEQRFATEKAAIEASLKDLRTEKAATDAEHERELIKWRETYKKYPAVDASTLDAWEKAREAAAKLQISNSVQVELAAALKSDVERLKGLETDMIADASAVASYNRTKQWIRMSLGLSIAGLVMTGGLFVGRGIKRRRERTFNTCPLCLGNKLEPVEPGHSSGAHPGLGKVRCTSTTGDDSFEECNFEFRADQREMVKICYPTLGIPASGKSHWLTMLYDDISRGNIRGRISKFETTTSEASLRFDSMVKEIRQFRFGTAATQADRISDPLIFNFIDGDRLGKSQRLVNIFDLSGEVTQRMTLDDRQRRRALDADGFFFFLDPTQPSEMQSSELARFREDIRRIKGVKVGGQIHTPVALCISKIDLMINQSYSDPDGGGVIGAFYRELGNIGWDSTLEAIKARSQLMAKLRDTIWPGWQIDRQIHDLFGGRYEYFPMTPVGLDGLGESDLASRTIAPVGLLDPLMWLLHMNGHPVLK